MGEPRRIVLKMSGEALASAASDETIDAATVERMAKEAEAHTAEDKAARDVIETRNQLDGMVYQVEKMLKEHGDKIEAGERGEVENALGDAKKALEGNAATTMMAMKIVPSPTMMW